MAAPAQRSYPGAPCQGSPFKQSLPMLCALRIPTRGGLWQAPVQPCWWLCKVSALCVPAGQARPPTLNCKCALPSLSLHQVGEPMYEDRTAFPRRLIEVVGSVPSPSCAPPLLGPLRELLLLCGGVAAGAAVVAGAWQRNRRKMKV